MNKSKLKEIIRSEIRKMYPNRISEKLVLKDWDKYIELVALAYLEAEDYDPSVVKHWKSLNDSNYKLFRRLLSKVDIIFVTNDKSKVGSIDIRGREFPIQFINPSDEYKTQSEMKADFKKTGSLKISIDYSDHPIFSVEDNIVFRCVHDFIVHILGNHGFSPKGEIASYNTHAKLVPPNAKPAIFTEIIGQTCAAIYTGDFAKQKITILKGFDFNEVGKVSNYDVINKTLSKKGETFSNKRIFNKQKGSELDFVAVRSN